MERCRLERGDAASTGDLSRGGRQVRLGELGSVQQRLGVTDEDERRVGQPNAASRPLQQAHACLALEHRELLGHRRGREAQRLGHGGDGSPGVQLAQEPQSVEVEHRPATLTSPRYEPSLLLTHGCGSIRACPAPERSSASRPPLPSARWAWSASSPTARARPWALSSASASSSPPDSLLADPRLHRPPPRGAGSRETRRRHRGRARRRRLRRAGRRSLRRARPPRPGALLLLLYVYPVLVTVAAIAMGRESASRRTTAALVLASIRALPRARGRRCGGRGRARSAARDRGRVRLQRLHPQLARRRRARRAPRAEHAALHRCRDDPHPRCFVAGDLHPGSVSPTGLAWLAMLAVVSTVAAITLFFAGLRRVGPSGAAILSTFEPVVTVGLAFVVFGGSLGGAQLVGGALVLGAVLVLRAPIRVALARWRLARGTAWRSGRSRARSRSSRAPRGQGAEPRSRSGKAGRPSTARGARPASAAPSTTGPRTIEETAELRDRRRRSRSRRGGRPSRAERGRGARAAASTASGRLDVLVNDIWGAEALRVERAGLGARPRQGPPHPAPGRRDAPGHEPLRASAPDPQAGRARRRDDRRHARVQRGAVPRLDLLRPGEDGRPAPRLHAGSRARAARMQRGRA